MPEFVPGIALARQFYREAVRPILDESFPGLDHAAGLIGFGSEVLGFDTPRSADHHWGPRVLLFLGEADCERHAGPIGDVMKPWFHRGSIQVRSILSLSVMVNHVMVDGAPAARFSGRLQQLIDTADGLGPEARLLRTG